LSKTVNFFFFSHLDVSLDEIIKGKKTLEQGSLVRYGSTYDNPCDSGCRGREIMSLNETSPGKVRETLSQKQKALSVWLK
jgi:hypothetical protein